MKKLTLTLINDRRGKGSSKNPTSVEIRFSYGSERRYVSTGVMVTPGQWSKSSQKIIKCKNADELNAKVAIYMDKAEKVAKKLMESNEVDLSLVQPLMQREGRNEKSFIEYCEERTVKRKVCEHTKGRYKVFTKFLRSWKKIVTFTDAENVANVRDMDEYLHRIGKKQSTIYDYHKYLKLFINDALVDGLMDKNPYKSLPFKIGRGEKKYVDNITEEQFEKLKSITLVSPHLDKVRDLFLFQCYTGMAYSDLMAFDYSECVEVEGNLFYRSKRTKTDVDFAFQLLEPAIEILKKYDYHLPTISNQKYNDYLKALGMMIGVEGMHSHMGRGTAATLFLSKGMQINIVQKVLGHTTLRQTVRYARTLNKDVRGAFNKLEGKL